MWETEQFWGTIDFQSIFFLLCSAEQDIHTGLDLLEGK